MTRHPNAIWFWNTPDYAALICVVNDLHRYEILEQSTGHRVHMASHSTLSIAKDQALRMLTTLQ